MFIKKYIELWEISRKNGYYDIPPDSNLNIMNESYNRPPYILTASSENKIQSSKIFSFLHKKNPCPNTSIYFISKGRLLLA